MSKRKNDDKPKLGRCLLFPHSMKALADRVQFGEDKYGPAVNKDWLKYDFYETIDSLQRHLTALANGESRDEDGLPHTGGVIFNACVLQELIAHSRESIHDPGSSSEIEQIDSCDHLNPLGTMVSCARRLYRLPSAHDLPSSGDVALNSAWNDFYAALDALDKFARVDESEKGSGD